MEIFLFRCCFFHSVYEARRLVLHSMLRWTDRRYTFYFVSSCSYVFSSFLVFSICGRTLALHLVTCMLISGSSKILILQQCDWRHAERIEVERNAKIIPEKAEATSQRKAKHLLLSLAVHSGLHWDFLLNLQFTCPIHTVQDIRLYERILGLLCRSGDLGDMPFPSIRIRVQCRDFRLLDRNPDSPIPYLEACAGLLTCLFSLSMWSST